MRNILTARLRSRALLVSTLLAAALSSRAQQADSKSPSLVEINVDTGTIVNTMRGGIGASWHAIEKPIPSGHGGSGWGAYPPAEDERAWQQIYRHADWLGLDFNRVEVEQRIYEPERDHFTFDSPEMRILYRILDWNQKNGADVFLQQMWINADWLAYPGSRGDPIKRVHSAPQELDAFASGLATFVDYLINKRGYTCIKWLSITNEPGANWSWWQGPSGAPLNIGAGLAAVRKALAQRGLKLPLSGPDAGLDHFADAITRNDSLLLDAYDFHDYNIRLNAESGGYMEKQPREIFGWANFAHVQGKPVFLSEFGTLDFPEAPGDRRPTSPNSILAAAEFLIRDANAGVDGFNRWSFLNRGDLDGQWQYVNTWDTVHNRLLPDFTPHPNSYFGLGLLSRFIAKHSAVLTTQVSRAEVRRSQRVFCAAFRSPKGNLTVAIVNDAATAYVLKLSWLGIPPNVKFFRYRYGEAQFDRADVTVDPEPGFSPPAGSAWTDSLPPHSLTIYSTYELKNGDPGVLIDDSEHAKN